MDGHLARLAERKAKKRTSFQKHHETPTKSHRRKLRFLPAQLNSTNCSQTSNILTRTVRLHPVETLLSLSSPILDDLVRATNFACAPARISHQSLKIKIKLRVVALDTRTAITGKFSTPHWNRILVKPHCQCQCRRRVQEKMCTEKIKKKVVKTGNGAQTGPVRTAVATRIIARWKQERGKGVRQQPRVSQV